MSTSFSLFDTPIGTCSLVWIGDKIVGLRLPEASADATRSRITRRWPGAEEQAPPPAAMQATIDRVLRLLAGEKVDLSDAPLDFGDSPDFHKRAYAIARTIPPGRTMTYGEIAKRLGEPHEAREVGQAMGKNPIAILMPCHRVLGADGKMGGFSANGGVATKRRILEIEGAAALGAGPLFAGLDQRRG
ncbi:MAG: methylated-DNA--[protein]-cysteine S-methyltransferase [Reyranella sp.]|uniref:methylated-DNA--[protein]-cysteine S-methyltransferase n=1 Tax=Reyranella sp. TaxID=1929291 RepID=UPI001AC5A054|nr:methylated-DNA--[protein]-cysteine S-methyltransferase [Reyranella sp.]MBN9087905.1 methylated-DNA--[protein]-cysteine S-methyltransferase [Reyranella sp.]